MIALFGKRTNLLVLRRVCPHFDDERIIAQLLLKFVFEGIETLILLVLQVIIGRALILIKVCRKVKRHSHVGPSPLIPFLLGVIDQVIKDALMLVND